MVAFDPYYLLCLGITYCWLIVVQIMVDLNPVDWKYSWYNILMSILLICLLNFLKTCDVFVPYKHLWLYRIIFDLSFWHHMGYSLSHSICNLLLRRSTVVRSNSIPPKEQPIVANSRERQIYEESCSRNSKDIDRHHNSLSRTIMQPPQRNQQGMYCTPFKNCCKNCPEVLA